MGGRSISYYLLLCALVTKMNGCGDACYKERRMEGSVDNSKFSVKCPRDKDKDPISFN